MQYPPRSRSNETPNEHDFIPTIPATRVLQTLHVLIIAWASNFHLTFRQPNSSAILAAHTRASSSALVGSVSLPHREAENFKGPSESWTTVAKEHEPSQTETSTLMAKVPEGGGCHGLAWVCWTPWFVLTLPVSKTLPLPVQTLPKHRWAPNSLQTLYCSLTTKSNIENKP